METYKFTGQVFSGSDSLQVLQTIQAQRALIVTDQFMVQFGYVDPIKKILDERHIVYEVFADVKPDPNTEVISQGIGVYKAANPDVVIAIGGGSVIDAAKGVMYFKSELDKAAWKRPLFVAIPTTSGTGSECTAFSVITTEKGKICIVEDWLVPDYAILDENYTAGVPESITYDTGIDVLTHSLEAVVSNKATVFTDAMAFRATKLVFDNLPKLKKNLKDMDARKKMHEASCMAGIAFSQSSLGLNHSLAHALGGTFHVAHGRANTVFLETVFDYNVGGAPLTEENYAAKKYAELAESLGLPARTIREGVMSLRAAIVELKNTLGVPKNIAALGIEASEFEAHIDAMAKNALEDRCTPTAPRQPSLEDLKGLYKIAYNQRF